MTVILIGTYVLISLGLNFFPRAIPVAPKSKAFPVFFTLLFILIFNPLRDRIQDLVDRLFLPEGIRLKQIMTAWGRL